MSELKEINLRTSIAHLTSCVVVFTALLLAVSHHINLSPSRNSHSKQCVLLTTSLGHYASSSRADPSCSTMFSTTADKKTAGALAHLTPNHPTAAASFTAKSFSTGDTTQLLTQLRQQWQSPSIDVASVQHLLDHDNHDMRQQLKQFMRSPLFVPRHNLSIDQERKLAYDRLHAVCSHEPRFFSVKDFASNPHRIYAAHELLGWSDGAMATKCTVQFNLFGGTVFKLGTQKHHDLLLDGIDRFTQVGCFGLTELGYGNNAVEMETTAVWDESTGGYTVHTPSTLAQKYWITNSAIDARWCVVFAQLIVKGQNCGVHGLLVRIRNDDHSIVPGVRIEDMGAKVKTHAKHIISTSRCPYPPLLQQNSTTNPAL